MPEKDEIVRFIRQRDFRFERFLDKGKGATGETALLKDEELDLLLVCKKYSVQDPLQERNYFQRFVEEVRLLFNVLHPNVVRVYSCHLYPTALRGYILMEYVDGTDIKSYLEGNKGDFDSLFAQVISAFQHLEEKKILHRDIRPSNIMVTNDGIIKVIDLGFGKSIDSPEGFGKSITLNWAASDPKEFENGIYTFCTECYFIGKLFQTLENDLGISGFSYKEIVRKMCEYDPADRFQSFQEVSQAILTDTSTKERFSDDDRKIYGKIADFLSLALVKFYGSRNVRNDTERVLQDLKNLLEKRQLETHIHEPSAVLNVFVSPGYEFRTPDSKLAINDLNSFLQFLQRQDQEGRLIVLSNLAARLSGKPVVSEDEIPF